MRVLVMISLAVALAVAPAYAHGRGGPCRQDVQALCKNVTPGPGGFRGCLKALCPNMAPEPGAFASCLQSAAAATQPPLSLSQACQDHLTQMQAKVAAFNTACAADLPNCSGVSGPRAVFRCLHQQQNLSDSCQQFLGAHHGHHHHHHHAPDSAPDSGQGNP
jgi:hypothetical protein